MSNLVIASPILSDQGTITAGSETTAGPVTNLQKMQLTDLWESESTTSYCLIDLGHPCRINFVCVLHTNAVIGDTWRVRVSGTSTGTEYSPIYDSGTMTIDYPGDITNLWDFIYHEQDSEFNVLTQRWVRIDFETVANPFYAGRVYVSEVYQSKINYKYGGSIGFSDSVTFDETAGGNLIPKGGANRQILDIIAHAYTEKELTRILNLNRERGGSSDVVVVTNPDAVIYKQDYIFYGVMQPRRVAVNTFFNMNEFPVQLTSLQPTITQSASDIWSNIVVNSEILTTEQGWVHQGIVSLNTSSVTLGNVTLREFIGSTGPATHQLRKTLDYNEHNGGNMFIAAYVKSGSYDWCFINVSATGSLGMAHGGQQYFDLTNGVLGSFVATNSGTLTDAGIYPVGDGYRVWAVIDCQSDDAFGVTHSFGPSDGDIGRTTVTGDSVTPLIHLGHVQLADGPTGLIPYTSTFNGKYG